MKRLATLSKHSLLAAVGLGLVLSACGEPKPSLAEALKTDEEKQLEAIGYKKKDIKRPDGLPPPTDAEFKAWDRKDPVGEKHLYKWDKTNATKMMGYWEEIQCFKEKMEEEGKKSLTAEPGSPEFEQWEQFKQAFIPHVNGWQQRLFAQEPRVMEKSKFIGNILEAHELVMHGYPKAFNAHDDTELQRNDAHWIIVQNKVKKYLGQLGIPDAYPQVDPEDDKQVEAHAKKCEEALAPPDRSGKEKKRKGKKGKI